MPADDTPSAGSGADTTAEDATPEQQGHSASDGSTAKTDPPGREDSNTDEVDDGPADPVSDAEGDDVTAEDPEGVEPEERTQEESLPDQEGSSGTEETPDAASPSTDHGKEKEHTASDEATDDANPHTERPDDTTEENTESDGEAAALAHKRLRRRRRRRRAALWVAASLAFFMIAVVATAYAYYRSLRSDMVQHDIDSVLTEEERPDKLDDAVNILFIGSDGYEEDSPAYNEEFEGERSDSLMLAHISPDNRASVISFPRDSLVQLSECSPYRNTDGTHSYFGMINRAMYHGGPPCVIRTIESLTDIRIDHFVHLSFVSFRDVVDSIGGVHMCIPEPMEDERSGLELDAGEQVLGGEEALAFVRARYEIGDGGDIGRIDRQQMFMAALADQVTSNDVLTSPRKLNGIAESVVRHSATDRELTLDKMVSIAVTLTDVDLSDIEFHTVPWYQAPHDPNRVMWNVEEAEELFTAVREGKPLPTLLAADDATSPEEGAEDGATPSGSEDSDTAGGEEPDEETPARPGEGRDATSNPCVDGLGFGTGDEVE